MRSSTREEYERRIVRAERYLEAHLDEAVGPLDVAKVAGMSLHHFHRVFRGMRGESVMSFSRRLRLERAARQLRTSERPLLEIALDAGYASHEAFTRAFTSAFDLSPSHYRQAAAPSSARSVCVPVSPPEHVEVREEPERNVLVMRHVGPYHEVGALWERFVAWHVEHVGPPGEMYALVPDDPTVTAQDKLRYDACFASDGAFALPLDGLVVRAKLPAGRYAVTVHRGSYETLAHTYLALIGGWFPNSGHALASLPVVERYFNSPADTASDDLLTEIGVRIEERGWMQ